MTLDKEGTADKSVVSLLFTHEDQNKHKRYLDMLKQEFLNSFATPAKSDKLPADYDQIKTLGAGAFGTVLLVRDKTSLQIFAMKALEKAEVIKNECLKQVFLEKQILQSMEFPFIMGLESVCKDNLYVYLILPFIGGGELFHLIKKTGVLAEELSQFYAAQIVLALEYLHNCGVVHRDLKPENIFISETGYIKLGDFGFAKVIKNRTWTLLGTPEYLAPEIILSKGYAFSVDWWALGILIFEMISGYTPFYCSDNVKLYEKILAGYFKAPEIMAPQCKQLVRKLLEVDPAKRYGSLKTGVYDIKSHAWFAGLNWNYLMQHKIKPSYVPEIKDLGDTDYFPEVSQAKLKRGSKCLYQKEFENF